MFKLFYPNPQAQDATITAARPRFNAVDLLVLGGVIALIYGLAVVGRGAAAPFNVNLPAETISLDPGNIPYYVGRSLLRIVVAMVVSLTFAIAVGYAAAKNRRLERVIIPILDILQSVPVLGFLTVTITAFIALFPGSLLGLECASVFAIFSSAAWNLAFSFYGTLKSLPRDMEEAARVFGLSRWQRLRRIEIPAATVGLVWNAMMSFGNGLFFLSLSEAFTVLNKRYVLPGLGSYVAQAVIEQNTGAILFAIGVVIGVVIAIDQLFWRPLVVWSDKFRMDDSGGGEPRHSWMLDLLRQSRLPQLAGHSAHWMGDRLPQSKGLPRPLPAARPQKERDPQREKVVDIIFFSVVALAIAYLLYKAASYVLVSMNVSDVLEVFGLGLLTLLRVSLVTVIASLIFLPLGVWIGFNQRVAKFLQPVVQVLVAFPGNFLFPFVTILLIKTNFPLDLGSIFLMALASQWYILFNVIYGAVSVPNDLREAARNFGVKGWQLWRTLILPGVYGAWVTGALTAMGGAWNASIVAEVQAWGNTTLTATGLGAYITQATAVGNLAHLIVGVSVMCIFVVAIDQLFWKRLTDLAETKFRLGN